MVESDVKEVEDENELKKHKDHLEILCEAAIVFLVTTLSPKLTTWQEEQQLRNLEYYINDVPGDQKTDGDVSTCREVKKSDSMNSCL